MPAMGLPGSSAAEGLTVSFAPITRTTEVLPRSSLMSSISRTMSYGTLASARSTFMCPGSRPATGWMPNLTFSVVWLARKSCRACANSASDLSRIRGRYLSEYKKKITVRTYR